MSAVSEFLSLVQERVDRNPLVRAEFYNSHDYCYGEDRMTHSRTVGIMVSAAWNVAGVVAVDVENRFAIAPKVSWNPDIVLRGEGGHPMIAVDFESPNSSDARVWEKDVSLYLRWCERPACSMQYLVVTSLPAAPSPRWLHKYTSPGCWNVAHKGRQEEVRLSPLSYWYSCYSQHWSDACRQVQFANFDGLRLHEVEMPFAVKKALTRRGWA